MKNLFIILILACLVAATGCSQVTSGKEKNQPKTDKDNLVLVKGGTFTNTKSNYYGNKMTLSDFYIGRYEVTQKEWTQVMGNNPSQFQGDNLPVEMVSWYDAVDYCNKRSEQEGLRPYYHIDKDTLDPNNKSEYDFLKWKVTINEGANGYRLPTEAEWEYAASGGRLSKSYTYSGSDQADDVSWYWRNSGDKTLSGDWSWPAIESNKGRPHTAGEKKANELGLYDMSGNVREWCWDWFEDAETASGSYRVVKGGGWIGDVNSGEVPFRGKFEASGYGPDQGFRVVRGE
ncbi:formylglycine-generating enzyme family protein [Paenibacillus physcomitrellae]|uniref:Sulfatase-modifying factor enzyme-like domain-containing protein n=1 Tax=Paenibacillus physcomitrellae TaxID=1619311 RepID=A0ABQ1FV27_9BACL|nr:SUMF1/EgtB/PvdO family nonheme iron enzyme [Paenibacillus physcomitrellae]GGA29097.1 hypothetical protein GCM10010917_12570 [Paenibacillus physcomitrellae]